MIILDGKKVSLKILEEVKEKVAQIDRKPHLAVILVGNNPASKIYVNNKKKAAEAVGIKTTIIEFEEKISELELINKIEELNVDNNITGILVQLPLPQHINSKNIAAHINPKKDVDGFSPENVGRLAIGLEPYFYPATPQGVLMLLDEYGIELESANAVVIGRSNIVGKPMTQMLLKRNATVTSCHSFTKNLDRIIKTADVVISAVGKKIVRCKMGNKNSVIVDVGIYKDSNGQLTGDVDFDYVSDSVGFISPVPGGVGPMTIASLMYNASKIYC
ncbi:MAG: bifunctional 5,10-methylenetetrahydrofolate dehydrogenase/5,10-methenyltetrahydrofolate cyclohydrolase [bacterium]|nr:bifunctional 5,10-methylenetetrahydrofolate dehydrogenase/5,10-methenyltetrahydrofolate cyclohydrolase [bacterium]